MSRTWQEWAYLRQLQDSIAEKQYNELPVAVAHECGIHITILCIVI